MRGFKKNQIVKINEKFRNRVRKYLIFNDMSREDFAEFCEVSLSTVKKIIYILKSKKDWNRFSMFIIDRICCYMGENFSTLLDEVEIKT